MRSPAAPSAAITSGRRAAARRRFLFVGQFLFAHTFGRAQNLTRSDEIPLCDVHVASTRRAPAKSPHRGACHGPNTSVRQATDNERGLRLAADRGYDLEIGR